MSDQVDTNAAPLPRVRRLSGDHDSQRLVEEGVGGLQSVVSPPTLAGPQGLNKALCPIDPDHALDFMRVDDSLAQAYGAVLIGNTGESLGIVRNCG
jgi:hypothetical protein